MAQTFNSFAELAAARGITPKAPKIEPARKCPKCGDTMKHVGNTNLYICEHVELVNDELKGKPVQVIRKCGNKILA